MSLTVGDTGLPHLQALSVHQVLLLYALSMRGDCAPHRLTRLVGGGWRRTRKALTALEGRGLVERASEGSRREYALRCSVQETWKLRERAGIGF